jgi:HAE1 family hydrophobic/amphiphilic exporter-1
MSAITTVCGMAPLVLLPGAGSEFYRGLGSVIIGGLLVSTMFTIFLIPALLSLTLDTGNFIGRLLRKLTAFQIKKTPIFESESKNPKL